jgi:hypothetical protein
MQIGGPRLARLVQRNAGSMPHGGWRHTCSAIYEQKSSSRFGWLMRRTMSERLASVEVRGDRDLW